MNVKMGIIKFEVNLAEMTETIEAFTQNRLKLFETISQEVKSVVSQTINQLLYSEMALFLGKPDQQGNKRNGYSLREYAIKGIGTIQIRFPVDRKRKFASTIVPSHEQIDPRLKEDMAVLHLAGLSTRTLAMISRRLLGVEVSADTVSRSLNQIKGRALEWLTRPISEEYWALFVDGTHFRIQRRGSTQKEPSLVVLGIDTSNTLSILAIEPGTKDNVSAWEAVFSEITKRGLNTSKIKIGIMDGLPGLESLFLKHFPYAVTGRCWVHALKNALGKVPARLEKEFKERAHQVMYASGEAAAREAFRALKEAMGKDAERALHCLEKDLDSLVAHYRFDSRFWRTLRSTNPIERVNKEFKRRAKSMETMGEQTLNTLLAFTAMRLEFNWKKMPIHSRSLENLTKNRSKTNSTEATIDAMFH